MRRALVLPVLVVVLAGAAGCKDPATAARQAREQTFEKRLAEGRALLEQGRFDSALSAARDAASALPTDARPHLLMAETLKQQGNDTAAILSLKQAAELLEGGDPEVRKQLADLYRRSGHRPQAIAVLLPLRDQGKLSDPEVRLLARLQAHEGQIDAAFKTLETIQRERPDDPDAKVLEAEILLLKGEETLAANLMDRLAAEAPTAALWLLRARYFFNNDRADVAIVELGRIAAPEADSAEVVQLKARALNALRRHDEAEVLLRGLLARRPRDEEALALVAETILFQGKPAEAQQMIDEALALRPTNPRALYVRARAFEAQGELQRAAENYQYALRADPGFAPALSRTWRIFQHRGEKGEAMAALERLLVMGEASLEERVALAELYAETRINLRRARRIIDEAVRLEPENQRFKSLRARIIKVGGTHREREHKGPIILRGGR